MSVASLAARLDALDLGGSFVTEGEGVVSVSNVQTADAEVLASACLELGWPVRVQDSQENAWPAGALDDEFAPFTVIIDKPAGPADVLRLLTNTGLADWLGRGDDRRVWEVGRLDAAFSTHATTFTPWNVDAAQPDPEGGQRNARRLVREAAGVRQVPASMNRWLLADRDGFAHADDAARTWANAAACRLMLALPDEIDGEVLRFRGPPRLELLLPPDRSQVLPDLTEPGFLALQEAVDWVFEIEREAEMRHILLATELARCGGSGDQAALFLRDNIADALAGARTAYQVQLAGMSSDALKTLSELRKSVSDDTAKVADGTRQIVTAVAGALAVGVGLVAARLSGTVNPSLVRIVLALAAAYVAVTVVSGVLFTLLQRKVRKAWQPRLYRFLSKADYDALVGRPARTAECALWLASALGAIAVALMIAAVTRIEPSAKLPPSPAGGTAERSSTDVQPGLPRAGLEAERNRVPAQDGSAKR